MQNEDYKHRMQKAEFRIQDQNCAKRLKETYLMWKWKATAAAFGVALIDRGIHAGAGTRAQAKSSSLTALDYIEIQQLANRYGQTIDTCSNNGYDYADLYTPDGVFIDKFSPDGFAKGGSFWRKGGKSWPKWWAADRSAASGR